MLQVMEKIELKETFETPYVLFDPQNSVFEIEGRSIPEDPRTFYNKLYDFLDQYKPPASKEVIFRFYLYYYNSSSAKHIFKLLNKLNELYKAGNKIKVTWEYESGDEDSYDEGFDFKNALELPFELKEVSE
ncbi:MAG: DUF1987 domain-containing protein [Flavobacteriales bacterium]